jgi:hypothetical protein
VSAGSNESELQVNRDLGRLAPAFALAVQIAIEECNRPPNNLEAKVYEGYRSQALQAMYFQRGRTVKPPIKPVTNAPTNLHSWHGFGLAVDVVHAHLFWEPSGGANWFRKVADIFKRHGCTWGGDWKMADLPHFQWGRCPPGPSDAARQLIAGAGMQAVWAHVGAVDGVPAPVVAPPAAAVHTRVLGIITAENFACTIFEDSDKRVHYTADADIDADGANGQNNAPAA